MKRTILLLAIVSLIAVPSMAKNNKGDVPQISWADPAVEILPAVDETPEMIKFDWEDEPVAEKYSLDIEGAGIFDIWVDDVLVEDVEIEFKLSYSAMDSELIMPLEDLYNDLIAAVLAELGVGMDDIDYGELLSLYAKVKGLDPHTVGGVKSQDNMFSENLDLLPILIPD
jgi:hypothetical protein